ncbi:uncharacterized protein LOC112449862 [Kryptolebias marmoratus]|uniref:uncharacterized protein LOC112449862 n=1 Tax=Kryptolebias marmoratus TaxID=37003 RepID=UPI000D530403|nr:uncharacterized protein LOC112449862 [Kryptolebias marmoratus]
MVVLRTSCFLLGRTHIRVMSINYTSFSNTSHFPLSSSLTIHELLHKCLSSRVGAFGITAFAVICVLLVLPLCIFVLYLGYQRVRQQHSSSTISHSDLFTYSMVSIELMNICGAILCCWGAHADISVLVMLGVYFFSITFSAQLLFHILTCVERYLAVVHPVLYLRNKNSIRLRTVIIVFSWLLSFVGTGVTSMAKHTVITIVSFCVVGFAVIVISYCSISVLCVLIHPVPGEGVGDRQQVDQSKLRAFHTIGAILGVLVLRFVGNISTNILYDSEQLIEDQRCGLWLSEFWFCLLSSLVLPLLFLHRTEKLPFCHQSVMSNRD